MDYFHTPARLITANELTIEEDELSHLTHVMRKKVGDTIRVVNGIGTAYDVVIAEIARRTARCEITETYPRLNESSIDLTLGVAILKNASKFDFLVEKVTELGVNTIIPLCTERTIAQHAKVDRWRKLALAAMKQSGRCVLPAISELTPLDSFIESTRPGSNKLISHERSSVPIASKPPTDLTPIVTLCIGPEGGFADEEVQLAEEKGFVPICLGPRRLRTETAAIVAAAIILGRDG